MTRFLMISIVLILGSALRAEQFTVATYNIENFHENFLAQRVASTRPASLRTPEVQELIESQRRHENEENWEISQVILDPKFAPDVLVVQEGCSQADLEFFNRRWLNETYQTVIAFDTNTDRAQSLCLLVKPGFKVLDRKDQYYREPDSIPNDRGNRLFARGPVFVLLEAPSGYRFWVGTNHQKSKADNSLEASHWRNREARRTHEIIRQIEKSGPSDLVFLGDMNDELGIQMYEMQAGGDTIANLVGPSEAGIFHATRALAEAGRISYFGYARPEYRSLIDHIFVTRDMKDQIEVVQVFQNSFTAVASDHCPVFVRLRADPVAAPKN